MFHVGLLCVMQLIGFEQNLNKNDEGASNNYRHYLFGILYSCNIRHLNTIY